jgi:hypothetical protein
VRKSFIDWRKSIALKHSLSLFSGFLALILLLLVPTAIAQFELGQPLSKVIGIV